MLQIPDIHREPIISHIVHVHQSLKHYTQQFLLKLRRKNFVTPKHYLDFINTYLKLIGWFLLFIFNKKWYSGSKFA